MKRTILIILIIITSVSFCLPQAIDTSDIEIDFGGPDSLYNLQLELKANQGNLSDCEFAIENAKKDFKQNDFSLHSDSFHGQCSYCAVLKQVYDIDWYFENDLFSEKYYICYDSIMKMKLIDKYGYDIFKHARLKVDSLEKTENWISDAEFIGGQSELLNFILRRLSIDSTEISNGIKTKIHIVLEIDSTGKAVNPIIKKGIGKKTNKKIKEIIEEMPNWKPAYLYGKPIKQQYMIPINIDYQ